MKPLFILKLLSCLTLATVPGFAAEPSAYLEDQATVQDLRSLYTGYKPFYLVAQKLPIPGRPPTQEQSDKESLGLVLLNNRQTPLLTQFTQREDSLVGWIYLFYSEEKDPAYYPKTKLVIEKTLADLNAFYLPYALTYKRSPPGIENNRLRMPIQTRFNYTFPCLPSAQTRIALAIMEELNGTSLKEANEYYKAMLQRRLIYALNYPSDLAEANALAANVWKAIQSSEAFQADLANAKTEWK